jgi:hypothetical protein
LINPHCPSCEFRGQCHAQAVEQNTLSLLRLKEKELKRYGRKGLFTLTQLAHAFRPRRKGRQSNRRSSRRYHALQALAIRDKRVYVLGAPEVRHRRNQMVEDFMLLILAVGPERVSSLAVAIAVRRSFDLQLWRLRESFCQTYATASETEASGR